jgi:hypothetical protein
MNDHIRSNASIFSACKQNIPICRISEFKQLTDRVISVFSSQIQHLRLCCCPTNEYRARGTQRGERTTYELSRVVRAVSQILSQQNDAKCE